MTLYFKLNDDQLKALDCPENTWFAVFGVPPDLETFSSTHLYECLYAESMAGANVALKLAELSEQDDFIEYCVKMWGEKRVKELLSYCPMDDVGGR